MFKVLLSIALAIFSSHAFSQSINEQWLGSWMSEHDQTLIVTQKNIVDKGKICRWIDKVPAQGHTGCVSFYDGVISKNDLLTALKSMRDEIKANTQNLDPNSLADTRKNVDRFEQTISQISEGNFRSVATSDADFQGSGDCGMGSYIYDKGTVYSVYRCEPAGIEGLLMVEPLKKEPATAPLAALNGNWYSIKWKYGYTLKDGLGTATATNSPRFKVGDEIIYLNAIGKNTFAGQQVYQDGKFYRITATLLPDGRLQFKGEKNISWIMDRK